MGNPLIPVLEGRRVCFAVELSTEHGADQTVEDGLDLRLQLELMVLLSGSRPCLHFASPVPAPGYNDLSATGGVGEVDGGRYDQRFAGDLGGLTVQVVPRFPSQVPASGRYGWYRLPCSSEAVSDGKGREMPDARASVVRFTRPLDVCRT